MSLRQTHQSVQNGFGGLGPTVADVSGQTLFGRAVDFDCEQGLAPNIDRRHGIREVVFQEIRFPSVAVKACRFVVQDAEHCVRTAQQRRGIDPYPPARPTGDVGRLE